MVNIEKYLEKAGGNWLRADDVQVGDRLEVLDGGVIDDQTFDKAYLVMKVKLARTGAAYDLRLGSKNVSRIAETLGVNTDQWVGKQLEVISIETYRGLGQKGMLLRGATPNPQTKPLTTLSQEAVNTIKGSEDIIKMNLPLSEEDFSVVPVKVRAELLRNKIVRRQSQNGGAVYFFTAQAEAYL